MIFFCTTDTTDTTDTTIWKPSLRERGFLGLEFRKYEAGVAQFGIFKEGAGGGGGSALNSVNFRGKTAKASLEIADLSTFLVCKSSTNQPWKQDPEA